MNILIFDTFEEAQAANELISDPQHYTGDITDLWTTPMPIKNGPDAGKWAIYDPAVNGTFGGTRKLHDPSVFEDHPGTP